MMNRIFTKLKSKSGASLILVMILFFLCVMIASVIVAAAASGASRSANREKQQQGYLSITSAVQMVIQEIEDSGKFVGREETVDYGCNARGEYQYAPLYYNEIMDVEETPVHPDITTKSGEDIWSVDSNTALDGAFGELLLKACTAIYDGKEESFQASFTIDSDDSRLAKVSCTFFMDASYNITMKFTAEDTDYAMTLQFLGNRTESTEPEVISCFHDITYTEVLEDGSMEENTTETRELEGEKTIRRITITWVLPTVSKGAD